MHDQPRREVIVEHYSDDNGNRRQYYKSEINTYCLLLDTHSTAVWYTTTDSGEPDTPLSNTDFVDIHGKAITFSLLENVDVVDPIF